MIKAGGKGFGREKETQTQGALHYHTLPTAPHKSSQPAREPVMLTTETSSRSRALHKEYFGTNHHNNLWLTYLKYHLNIKF